MDFELTANQKAWRDEIRAFLRENVTEDVLEDVRRNGHATPGAAQAEFSAKVGAKGWFGLTWPKEFGGLGVGAIYEHIFINELEYWGAPRPGIEVTSIAPMIMRYGTERNREEFVPPIARGELKIALGYSEPSAGTDLASLRTRAELDGDEWVINGHKIWNSGAHRATHQWLAVRTDPSEKRHKGISVVMVPVDTPGIEVRPLVTWADSRTNETWFNDVRVPATNLIGELNNGWQYITGALALERGFITSSGDLRRAIDDVIALSRRQLPDGTRPADDPNVRRRIAQLDADVEACELMGLEACSAMDRGELPTLTVTEEKIHSSELRQRVADVAMQMLGMYGLLTETDPDPIASGDFERLYRTAPYRRFGGGANEALRDLIAKRAYDMPSYRR